MAPIYWQKLSFEAKKARIAAGTMAIWPVGGCISKKDDLPLDFPRQCARRLAEVLSTQTGWPILEPLDSGVSLDLEIVGHFPATLLQLAIEELQDARKAGFTQVWVLSGTRANNFALECARQTIERSFPAFRSPVRCIWDICPALADPAAQMALAGFFEDRNAEGAQIWEQISQAWTQWAKEQ